MEFIFVPLVVGIITAGIYGIFELLVHRKERLNLVEKLGSDINPELLKSQFSMGCSRSKGKSYGALKIGGLITGMGLGLLIGFFIYLLTQNCIEEPWRMREVIYGASVLLFGGLGLLIAFAAELKLRKKDKE